MKKAIYLYQIILKKFNKKYKKGVIQPFNKSKTVNDMKNYMNKTTNNSMIIANKIEKMDMEKINFLLNEKYLSSKKSIIEKLFGKKEINSSFE